MPKMSYLKVFNDFEARTGQLNDVEKGRLLLAMWQYATQDVIPDLKGNERFLFDNFKIDIDNQDRVNRTLAENGKKGGRPSADKTKQNQTKPKKTKANQDMTVGYVCLQEQEQEKEKEHEQEQEYNPPLSPLGGNDDLERALKDFADHRKKLKKPMTPHALDLIRKKLEALAPGDADKQVAIVEQSIQNGWQGVFDLKSQPGKTLDYNRFAKPDKHTSYNEEDYYYDIT